MGAPRGPPARARSERELDAYVVRFSEVFDEYLRLIRNVVGLPMDGLEPDAAMDWLNNHESEHFRIAGERPRREMEAAARLQAMDARFDALEGDRGTASDSSLERSLLHAREISAAGDPLWAWRNDDRREPPLLRLLMSTLKTFDLPESEALAKKAVFSVVAQTIPILSVEAVNSVYSPRARIQRDRNSSSITITGISFDISDRTWMQFWTDAIKPRMQRDATQISDAPEVVSVELSGPPRRADLPWRLRAYELHVELARTIPETLAEVRDEFPGEFASADTPSDEPSRRRKLLDGIAEIRKRVDTLDARSRAHGGDAH